MLSKDWYFCRVETGRFSGGSGKAELLVCFLRKQSKYSFVLCHCLFELLVIFESRSSVESNLGDRDKITFPQT